MEEEQWPVGSPAWQQHQPEQLEEAIANIGTVFTEPESVEEEPVITEPPKPGTTYVWTQEDTWAIVAKRFNLTRQELLDHNGIDDPDSIQPGDSIHLPFVQEIPRDMAPTFEVLPEPLPMHVKKDGGCKKWSFGNMRKWDDAKGSGFFPQDSNLTIVAIAHVPVEDKENPEAEAAYYMDANALGDYAETGHIRWAIGYIWSDLAEGHIDKTNLPPKPVAERVIAKQKAELIAKKAADKAAEIPHYLDGFDKAFIEKRLQDILRDGADHFKLSRQMLPAPVSCTAMIPADVGEIDAKSGKRYVIIHDYDTKRPDRKLYDLQEVVISQTFEYDGILLGRPLKAAENGNWYGIDMSLLQSDDELYNTKSDASTRAAEGRSLTWSERMIWVPLAKFGNHPVLVRRRQEKQNKNKKG